MAIFGPRAQPALATEPPNIVVVMSDDQAYDMVDVMPFVSSLPGLEPFDVLYDNISLCCPARATFLTGLYSQHTGVDANDGTPFDPSSTIATWLHAGGYSTGLFGKYLNFYPFGRGARYVPPNWDRWVAFADPKPAYFNYTMSFDGKRRHFGSQPTAYSTDVLARQAASFVRTAPEPFFALVTPYGPHTPRTPPPRYSHRFRTASFPFRPNFNLVADRAPRFWRRLPKIRRGPELAKMRKVAATLLAVDDLSRSVVEAADARGETVFLYMSDNGYSFGSHRFNSKGCGYEECGRIAGLIRGPGDPTGTFASIADLAPTLADVAGVPHPPTDGRSLLPVMLGDSFQSPDRAILLHLPRTDEDVQPSFWGVRTERWKYLRYGRGAGPRHEELFDLQADPYEMRNLAFQPGYGPVLNQLREDLQELRAAAPAG